MKKLYATLLMGTVAASALYAAPRSQQQALAIAREHAASVGTSIVYRPTPATSGQEAQNAAYYTFNKEQGGYVIVSGEDKLPAIVGYTDHGTFDYDNLPDALKAFLKAYTATVQDVASLDGEDESAEGSIYYFDDITYPEVKPLLENIEWDQKFPYNLMCPMVEIPQPDGTTVTAQCITGCAATAASQIMRYHKFPANQVAIDSYMPQNGLFKEPIPAIPASTDPADAYDWDHMLPQYVKDEYGEVEAFAVAKLMLHVGCAQHMSYSPSLSAAEDNGILKGFQVFGYDTSLLQLADRSYYTRRSWVEMINNEMAHKRPIQYNGLATGGGHSFVLDGSNGKGLYHINWGWNGSSNGYFDIAVLNPHNTTGSGAATSDDGYISFNSMILGITPYNGEGEQPRKPDFTDKSYLRQIEFSYTDLQGGNNFYYSTLYKYYNNMMLTVTNHSDRPVNDFLGVVLNDANAPDPHEAGVESTVVYLPFDLLPGETSTQTTHQCAPTDVTDAYFEYVLGLEYSPEEKTKVNMIEVADPELNFSATANVTKKGEDGYWILEDDVFEGAITIINNGAEYSGKDFFIGLAKDNSQYEYNKIPEGRTEYTYSKKIEPGEEGILCVATGNPNIPCTPAMTAENKGGLVVIKFRRPADITAVDTINATEAPTVSKRFVNGRFVIDIDGEQVDLLGRK